MGWRRKKKKPLRILSKTCKLWQLVIQFCSLDYLNRVLVARLIYLSISFFFLNGQVLINFVVVHLIVLGNLGPESDVNLIPYLSQICMIIILLVLYVDMLPTFTLLADDYFLILLRQLGCKITNNSFDDVRNFNHSIILY